MSAQQQQITIFGVVKDGRLAAEQENSPMIILPPIEYVVGWSWQVLGSSGFSGQPTFWITHPSPGDTFTGALHWAGIAIEDWEKGRNGQVTIECIPAGYEGVPLHTVTLEIAIRSIDGKDLTFMTADMQHLVRVCRPARFDSYRVHLESALAEDELDSGSLDVRFGDDNTTLTFRLSSFPSSPVDRHARLVLSDPPTLPESGSVFTLNVAVRPLVEEGKSACSGALSLVKDEPITLGIEGEPTSTAGYAWSIENLDVTGFKLSPTFKDLGQGQEANLELEKVSDWDWINGTSGGMADLVIRDGDRAPARIPITFGLARTPMSFTLEQGEELRGPGGEKFVVTRTGSYEPVSRYDESGKTVLELLDVPVRSVDEGAGGNIAVGEELSFVEKMPLIGPAYVGSTGLNKGDDAESDAELRNRVHLLWAFPPAHGNRSHVVKIMEQVEGVDRAFVYPPMALDGYQGFGKVGCALVAPGRRAGVGARSPLALEVLGKLATQGSMTAEYVMMDVDAVGPLDAFGKGACQVDVDIQIGLADKSLWHWDGVQNLVIEDFREPYKVYIFRDESDIDRAREVDAILCSIRPGDILYILGKRLIVKGVHTEPTSQTATTAITHSMVNRYIEFVEPILKESGEPMHRYEMIGQRVYPPCPVRDSIEAALDRIFQDLGTSEAKPIGEELLWQRRFPYTTFLHPDELRVAELYNQIMDIEGIEDMRVLVPERNVAPPPNRTTLNLSVPKFGSESSCATAFGAEGGKGYKTFILSLRRISIGPFLPTAGVDDDYQGPMLRE